MTVYVKVPGVDGRSTEVSLKWIETLSWHWEVGQIGDPTPESRKCSFTMEWDTAAHALFSKAHSGEHIADVRVDFTRDMGKAKRIIIRVVLGDVQIHSVVGIPAQVELDFRKIQSERV